ncbi:RNA polymerase sigma factor, sigma-70 family [Caulobacter sp. AP07]|uniref:sigma-70 family RNA polymerase sigma factor n=1 Tax=Caulobacter sp. AP07 TaxID=1144304 RepID=UPI000271EE61|nr:sigma-70 family RNA polymerase sigma factor [Caulobacter sp. AP07]EJL23350.1 RNA polymerase sigma factor, sigma-70 family [Caulobacter sp. AP07]
MSEQNSLAGQFEANRAHLRRVAYRMLGSHGEADDAVQEAWLRLSRSDAAAVANLGGWLTTVVSRVCLDMLRARRSRREDALGPQVPEPAVDEDDADFPGREMLLADSIGLAMTVVLEALPPAERVAFVLHDLFDLPFEEIAVIVGRTPGAARQLASRARRRVRGATTSAQTDQVRQRQVVDAFLAASRGGDLSALLAVLDPDVVFRSDAQAVRVGGAEELRGADAVAATFVGRAQAARPALVDGALALAVERDGRLFVVLRLAVADGRITSIEAVADHERLAGMTVVML